LYSGFSFVPPASHPVGCDYVHKPFPAPSLTNMAAHRVRSLGKTQTEGTIAQKVSLT